MELENPIIQSHKLSKTYFLGNVPVHALKNVSFTISSGDIVFVMGPSGSGKTTLLNLIGGIDTPTTGKIIVCNKELSNLSAKRLTQYRKDHLAFVFQFYSLIPTLTALENVEMILELSNLTKKEIRSNSKRFLDMVGLTERKNNFPSQLSGGERQRVAIARALAKNPDVLLIDEPTGQLDQDAGHLVTKLIRDIAKKQKKTVVLVTHDPELQVYADRVIKLRSGKIIEDFIINKR